MNTTLEERVAALEQQVGVDVEQSQPTNVFAACVVAVRRYRVLALVVAEDGTRGIALRELTPDEQEDPGDIGGTFGDKWAVSELSLDGGGNAHVDASFCSRTLKDAYAEFSERTVYVAAEAGLSKHAVND